MSTSSGITIVKASGDRDVFSESKLRDSLQRSGAGEKAINRVVAAILNELYEGMPTRKIYRRAYQLLRKESHLSATRYNLKQAVMDLGPSGYPFEALIGRLLEKMGYRVKVALMMQGKCVGHEVDVLAEKNNERFLMECKFHNRPGVKSDVRVGLYFHSRFQDLKAAYNDNGDHSFHQGWIVTNTKFTSDAIRYAECTGMHLMGWDHPRGSSLVERLENARLYPLTLLHSLSKKEKKLLIDNKLILAEEIFENTRLLASIGLDEPRIRKVIKECKALHEGVEQGNRGTVEQ
jgi:hypothetical protein